MVCPSVQFILLGKPAVDATVQTQFVARHSRESQGLGWKCNWGGSTFVGDDCIYAGGYGHVWRIHAKAASGVFYEQIP